MAASEVNDRPRKILNWKKPLPTIRQPCRGACFHCLNLPTPAAFAKRLGDYELLEKKRAELLKYIAQLEERLAIFAASLNLLSQENAALTEQSQNRSRRYSHPPSVAFAALNIDWPVVERSCQGIGVTRSFLPGLELAELFYAEVVAPILQKALDGVPYSAALIGWGSEVQGFDTVRSTDHAWGPRMQLFLGSEDFLARADELDALLDRELPVEFRSYPVRFAFPPDEPARHWVHVTDLRDFFTEHLGVDPASGLPTSAWLAVPTQVLRELTGGVVFHDGMGLLAPYRKLLAWFPDDVWRYILACQWMRLSQEEPLVGRCGEVGDDLGSAVVAARQVRDLMKLCLLMNRVYPPYSKWLGTAFAALPCARALTPHLSGTLSARSWQEREQQLSPAYEVAGGLHNEFGLTEPLDVTVRHFHDRPFRVLDAYRFTDALVSTISDPAIRALPPIGAIDQYVDNTDLTDRTSADLRRRYIAGPGLSELREQQARLGR